MAIGWGVSKLTGQEYSWKDAAVDFGLGFATSGLSSLTKLKHAGKLVQWATRAGAETALDTGAEIARKEWKGEDYTAGEIATGAATNLVIGEGGAAVGRKFGKWWRSFRQGDEAVEQAAKSVDSPNISQGQKTAVIQESPRGRGDAPKVGEKLDAARPAGDSAVPPPPDVRGPPSGASDLRKLAKEAHGVLDPRAQLKKSTAVGEAVDLEGQRHLLLSSSDPTVPAPQKKWAQERGVRVVQGEGHAEETLVRAVDEDLFLRDLQRVDAESPLGGLCVDCEALLKSRDIGTTTPPTGKKSRRRR